jgi:hypothetical protein
VKRQVQTVLMKSGKCSANQRVTIRALQPEIMLDIPQSFTYHTFACAKGLTAHAVGDCTRTSG